MRVASDSLFTAEAVASQTKVTETVSLDHLYAYAVWASWSGTTIAGSIKLQASIDGTNWNDVADSSQTISAASTYLWNITEVAYPNFRVSVTADNANVITTTVKFYAKGF
jgi:hypothetical protein